jgi:GNAT superfamily N-acetyltransferase
MTGNDKPLIRRAVLLDEEPVCALLAELGGKLAIPTGSARNSAWHALITHTGTLVYVADINGKIASTATIHILPNMTNGARPYALIENVITNQNYRNIGLGRLLMEHAIREAWNANAYKIMLLTGKFRKDGGSIGFYKKLGFRSDEKCAMTMRRVPERD